MPYLSLYIHFPFCKRKCFYCDFCSAASTFDEMSAYCDALCKEMAMNAKAFADMTFDTVFFGGGTPSIVPSELMKTVTDCLNASFSFAPKTEFTCEANPGTLTDEWLDTLLDAGMNRLSLGVQAKQERLLRVLGRIHDYPQAVGAIALAKRHGVCNLNADVMFGLPTQSQSEYLDTLEGLCAQGLTHLSAYSLIVEDGTPLKRQIERGELTLPDDDATEDMLEAGVRLLDKQGFHRYEISNFAKEGCECRHNLAYWTGKRYLGLGLSAASMLDDRREGSAYRRVRNVDSMKAYLSMLHENRLPIAEDEPIAPKEARFETIMLGLRTVRGVSATDFAARHGVTLEQTYGPAMKRLTAEGLLRPMQGDDPYLSLTERGMALQNAVLMAFMD